MFESWSQWTWVSIAWLEVTLAFSAYFTYLNWRRRRLLRDERAQRLLSRDPGRQT